ncbi:sensor domain-containing protein [Streptomyces oceani]|uniref:Putative sensor domain-containing protein n=1 Tax=Streptomyces oceani TaxID=1075402 RepID=A0A1E7KIE0_9ACTN|nr:sensor domain-containing protein [Streptomyces oceani]OEV03728.1 hypothetical protein AN216_10655 [Streptomyces oceani]
MTPTTAPPAAPYSSRAPYVPETGPEGSRFGRQLSYLITGLPLGIAGFVIAVTGFTTGVGSLVAWLGLPILVGTLLAARGLARVERRRVESATDRRLPPHYYRDRAGSGPGGWLRSLGEPQAWRDLAHLVVAFPVRTVGFCLAMVWTVGGVGELTYGLWSWFLPRDEGETGLLDLAFDIDSRLADIGFHTAVGVLLLATAVPVVRGLVAVQAGLARGLLTNQYAAERADRHSTLA